MKASTLSRTAVLLCVVLLIIGAAIVLRSSDNASTKRHSADLEYLKSVNSVAPLKDPELLFVLMTEFANSNLQGEGAEFFSARLKQFENSPDRSFRSSAPTCSAAIELNLHRLRRLLLKERQVDALVVEEICASLLQGSIAGADQTTGTTRQPIRAATR
jgi:hypothetical protein